MGDFLTKVGSVERQEARNCRGGKSGGTTSYGLTGLTAMLVMAFCFAYQ